MFKPVCKENQLIFGNPQSQAGIVTLWSKRERIAEKLDKKDYAAMGQLYSTTRGLDPLIRNLLANPQIRYLFVCGRDLSNSGLVLQDFFKNGVSPHINTQETESWKVNSKNGEGYIDKEIPEKEINKLRENVELIVCDDPEKLKGKISTTEKCEPYAESKTFPKQTPKTETYPYEGSGMIVREKTVAQTWLKILDAINRFGRISGTHYDSRQKEILNLMSVVTDENPDNLYVPYYLPCDKQKLEEYFPRVLSDKKYPDCSYTYGQRLHSYFGVDQIESIITALSQELEARSAVASLWDPTKDGAGKKGSPCLNHIWARAAENKLYLTAVIRSNDMFSAWPENAFALRKLQGKIKGELEKRKGVILEQGDLIIISQSAHIYEDCWQGAQEIVDKHYVSEIKWERHDPRGHFVIELKDGKIVVEHVTFEGTHLAYYKDTLARKLSKMLDRNQAVSSLDHATYLGEEFQKAELALKYPDKFKYVQDQPLKLI